ncbi:TIGR03943 family putative permease subunit [Priestia abyssalis]|uniref:TIGR03943 family putative permease subunit n=1 Tax=Priestia abyssalis TaxID=1221450 RepID=UPI0011173C82|nr:TIGR03943 family protein [Priestia abyssalis]
MEHQTDQSFQAFIRGVILVGFSLLMFKLMLSGDIRLFIAPRMMPFIYFASLTFFLLGVMQIWRSGSKHEHHHDCMCDHGHHGPKRSWQTAVMYALFILPVITGFLFSNNILDSSVAEKRGIKFGANATARPAPEERQEAAAQGMSEAELYLEDPEKYMEELDKRVQGESAAAQEGDLPLTHEEGFQVQDPPEGFYDKLEASMLTKDHITVPDETFIPLMNIFDRNPEAFAGKEIELMGFVYREPDFAENQFVIARFGLSCCVADASVYGMLGESKGAEKLGVDQWVKIKGTLTTTEYNSIRLPYIKISQFEKIDAPPTPYVYEFYEGEELVAP